MTLWAFAAVGPATSSPKAIVAAVSHETDELRMSLPNTAPSTGRGASLPRAGSLRQAAFESRRLGSEGLLDAVAGGRRGRTLGRIARRSTQILRWPRGNLPEFLRGMQRPIGVAQHFAGEQHDIGLLVADDLIGLSRRGDHADRRGGDIGFAANPPGERRLISGSHWNLRLLDIAARRAIDQIDPQGEQKARKLDRLVDVPPAFNPVR